MRRQEQGGYDRASTLAGRDDGHHYFGALLNAHTFVAITLLRSPLYPSTVRCTMMARSRFGS